MGECFVPNLPHSLESMIHLQEKGTLHSSDILRHTKTVIQNQDPQVHCMLFVPSMDHNPKDCDGDNRVVFPFMASDNILALRTPTTCGSKIMRNYISPFDATVVERLRKAGGVLVGKTNMDEFSMGLTTETSGFFPTSNPHDLQLTPGGGCGGSAAAVASGIAPVALGSDAEGSIRIPASFCRVIGYKPSYGVISRYGLISPCPSLDAIGLICRSTRDAALSASWIMGPDHKDATMGSETIDLLEAIESSVDSLRLCLLEPSNAFPMDFQIKESFDRAVQTLRKTGIHIQKEPFISYTTLRATHHALSCAEAVSSLSRCFSYARNTDPSSLRELGLEVKSRILFGTLCLSDPDGAQALHAARCLRNAVSRRVCALLKRYDAVISPTTPFLPPKSGSHPVELNTFAVLANLAGLPAITIPMGPEQELLCGLQIMCGPREDAKLFQIARQMERILGVDLP